jgi:hypothetical protein
MKLKNSLKFIFNLKNSDDLLNFWKKLICLLKELIIWLVVRPFICSFHIAHSTFILMMGFHFGLIQLSASNPFTCECEYKLDVSSMHYLLGPRLRLQHWWCHVWLFINLQMGKGVTRLWAKRKAQESHFMLLGVLKSVREWTLTLLSEFHVGSLSPMDSRSFRMQLQGWKPINLKSSLYH